MNKADIRQGLMVFTVVLILGILGFAGYQTLFSGPTGTSAQAQTTQTASPGEHPAKPLLPVGTEAPNFILPNLAGQDVMLTSFRGQKLVLLEFFATWCPHCRHSDSSFAQFDCSGSVGGDGHTPMVSAIKAQDGSQHHARFRYSPVHLPAWP